MRLNELRALYEENVDHKLKLADAAVQLIRTIKWKFQDPSIDSLKRVIIDLENALTNGQQPDQAVELVNNAVQLIRTIKSKFNDPSIENLKNILMRLENVLSVQHPENYERFHQT